MCMLIEKKKQTKRARLLETLAKQEKVQRRKSPLSVFSPCFLLNFFCVNVAISYHGSLSPVALGRDGRLPRLRPLCCGVWSTRWGASGRLKGWRRGLGISDLSAASCQESLCKFFQREGMEPTGCEGLTFSFPSSGSSCLPVHTPYAGFSVRKVLI